MLTYDKTYTTTEYGGFTRGRALKDYQELPESTFDALETFILSISSSTQDAEMVNAFSLSARNGVGKIITARNYVGLITMKDGTVIEILPKIAGEGTSNEEAKKIFIDMLKALKTQQFKQLGDSSVDDNKLNLLEIFIKMFLTGVITLVKKGLKSSYIQVESNERFYKGKLMVSQNIKHNLINREKFFVSHDDFNLDMPENRIIKATLQFLLKVTSDWNNRRNIIQLLGYFDSVSDCENAEMDFLKCIDDRSMQHYQQVLSCCRIFLKKNSFSAFSGNTVSIAILFPMEKVFESYIAEKLRKQITSDMKLLIQDKRYHLFDNPHPAFSLMPDIVLETEGGTVIIDTKWKILSSTSTSSGISQADMYQMYAYSKKYSAKKINTIIPIF